MKLRAPVRKLIRYLKKTYFSIIEKDYFADPQNWVIQLWVQIFPIRILPAQHFLSLSTFVQSLRLGRHNNFVLVIPLSLPPTAPCHEETGKKGKKRLRESLIIYSTSL